MVGMNDFIGNTLPYTSIEARKKRHHKVYILFFLLSASALFALGSAYGVMATAKRHQVAVNIS
jgi:hypothetical protein